MLLERNYALKPGSAGDDVGEDRTRLGSPGVMISSATRGAMLLPQSRAVPADSATPVAGWRPVQQT